MKIKKFRTPMGVLLAKEPHFGVQPKVGGLIEGTVLEKTGKAVYVDLPPFGTGIVFGKEYREAKDIIRSLKPGAPLVAKVVEVENDDGYVELSLREAGRDKTWERLRELKEKNESATVSVVGANRGGLIVELEGVQGFLPASQLGSEHYPRVKDGDKNKILIELQKLIGQGVAVKIITVSPKEDKLIVSEKEVELEGLSGVLARYHVGDIVEGEVSGVVDFGAFMRFRAPVPNGSISSPQGDLADARRDGSVDSPREEPELEGLIHISELDYKLVTNPADILKVGERVKAKIISIDRGRVSLSLKRLKEDPWEHIEHRYAKGDLVQGKVIKLDRYGALVELSPGIHGLCHISELGGAFEDGKTPMVGESYPFRILELKADERKLALGFLRRPRAEKSETDDERSEDNVVRADEYRAPETGTQETFTSVPLP